MPCTGYSENFPMQVALSVKKGKYAFDEKGKDETDYLLRFDMQMEFIKEAENTKNAAKNFHFVVQEELEQ